MNLVNCFGDCLFKRTNQPVEIEPQLSEAPYPNLVILRAPERFCELEAPGKRNSQVAMEKEGYRECLESGERQAPASSLTARR